MNIFRLFLEKILRKTENTPKLPPSPQASTREGLKGKISTLVYGPNMEKDYESCYEDYQELVKHFNYLYDLMFLHLNVGIIVKDEYNIPSYKDVENAKNDWFQTSKYNSGSYEIAKRVFFGNCLKKYFDKQDSKDEKTQSDEYVEELINTMQQMNRRIR